MTVGYTEQPWLGDSFFFACQAFVVGYTTSEFTARMDNALISRSCIYVNASFTKYIQEPSFTFFPVWRSGIPFFNTFLVFLSFVGFMAVEYWLILISCPHNTVSHTKEVFVDDATVPTE